MTLNLHDWLKSRCELLAELGDARRALANAHVMLIQSEKAAAMWQEIAANGCPDTAVHARLAHRLHVSETLRAMERGEDPHKVSLP